MAKADHGSWKYLYMPILNTIDKDIYEAQFYTAQRNNKELFVAYKKLKFHKKWAYNVFTASHRSKLSIILDRKNNFLPRFYLFLLYSQKREFAWKSSVWLSYTEKSRYLPIYE